MHCLKEKEDMMFKKLIDESVLPNKFILMSPIGRLARMSVLDTDVDGSNPGSSMLFP